MLVKESQELKIQSQLIGTNAYMLLNAPLGYDSESSESYINGGTFAQKMYDLKSQGYKITVKINCPGGLVTDGYSVIDAIVTTGADTHNIGIAASMGLMCLLSGKHRKANEGTSGMAHAAAGGNTQFKEIVRTGLSDLMDKRTRIPKDKITEMMTGLGMHWFDASEMSVNGMVDEVIPTDQKFIKPTTKNALEMYKVYNSLNKTEEDMDFKELVKGIFPGKSDAEVVTNTLQLKAENEALKAKNATSEAEIVTLRKAITDANKASKDIEIKNLVDGAVKAGKIVEGARASWVVMATADFDSAKTALESITKVKNSSAAAIVVKDASVKSETGTYAYLTKNDPKKLAEIMSNDPAEFDRLLTEFENSPKEIKK